MARVKTGTIYSLGEKATHYGNPENSRSCILSRFLKQGAWQASSTNNGDTPDYGLTLGNMTLNLAFIGPEAGIRASCGCGSQGVRKGPRRTLECPGDTVLLGFWQWLGPGNTNVRDRLGSTPPLHHPGYYPSHPNPGTAPHRTTCRSHHRRRR